MDVKHFAFLARQPSASLQPRERFWGMPKRGIALILANAMFWQPMWAQADGIVVSGGSTSVGAAGNGVPIVNIAAPNANGLSHNQFQQYNVGSQGVILNNATAQTQSTQLGGIIIGNSSLQGTGAATTILNEVVSNNRSELKGYTEVAGQAARVIVANPYGITCDGCGFINTPQVTLSTGKPVLDNNGNLVRFNVQGGSVSIDGQGINADNLDQFDIITRSAKINAELHAKKLNIIAGRNDVDAQTLEATALADDGSIKPTLAIDSTALGGMYAGAVKLVGTEAGVGVRLASNVAASAGDIQIDANGQLSMVQAVASGAVDIKATGAELNGPLYAGSSLSVATSSDLTVSQDVVARDSVSLSSAGKLINNAIIEAGVNADNSRNASGDVVLSAANLTNTGSVVASRNLQATATQTLDNQGATLSGQASTRITTKTLDNRGGRVITQGQLTVQADSADNRGGVIRADKQMNLFIGSLDNSQIGLTEAQKGAIIGKAGVQFTGKQLDNRSGTLNAAGLMQLQAETVFNANGRIASQTELNATVDHLTQQGGELVAQGALTLTGKTLDNQAGGLVGATKALKVEVTDIDNRTGEISSQAGVEVIGDVLDNRNGGKVLAGTALQLVVKRLINQSKGLLFGQTLNLDGQRLENTGGTLASQQDLTLTLTGVLDNSAGRISSEAALTVKADSLDNTSGSLSSAKALKVTTDGALLNQAGAITTDASLTLVSASLDNRQAGTLSGKGATQVTTGAFDNSQGGQLTSGGTLELVAGKVINQSAGRIASALALNASVTGLDQQGGELFSNTTLSLDLNNGQLNNQGGLINSPGTLLLKNLNVVANQGGEISSGQAFTLAATSLDNSAGKLLGNQALTLRIAQALDNVKGLIAAAGVDATAGTLDNTGGTLTSRNDLELTVTGQLTNRDEGLINAAQTLKVTSADLDNSNGQLLGDTALTLKAAALDNRAKGLINSNGALTLTADSLDTSNGGEVSALGTMTLVLNALSLDAGRLIGDAGLSVDLNGGDLSSRTGLITAKNLTFANVRDVNNQGGEISSDQSFTLAARTLDNNGGKLISGNQLTLEADSLLNQGGLISGWQGLSVTGSSLDNRNSGTLSSRNGAVDVDLSGELLNSAAGALVSQKALSVTADSLDNSGGILSSALGQTLTITGLLNNSQSGLIDSGADLLIDAGSLDNSAGTVSSKGKTTLDLLGSLTNTGGKLASAGDLLLKRSGALANQGGQLISQSLMTLNTGTLDNSHRGTAASNGTLLITASGKVLNSTDGLIYSQNADVKLEAASLENARGTVQGQSTLSVETSGDIDNQSGSLIAQNGNLSVEAASLDSRGGLLSSLKGLFTAQVTGVLKNGYDLTNNRQGGVIQGQRLNLTALGGFDNYGGRVSASTGDALLTTANVDNRNGGIYAKGLVRVTGNDFDNSGDNDGQIAGGQVNLNLSGALNNRLGIIESDSTLAIKAASLDNQTGQIRSLGTSDAADFQIGNLFDNRNGTVEVANSKLILNAASFSNTAGSLLHTGRGVFDISTANLLQASGTVVTGGDLTITADNWTNTGVLQAGRLTVNVGTLNQTASGQLLASTGFVGTGGNWTNDGVIASDGLLGLSLGGVYSGSGRASSLGVLDVSAAQLNLASEGELVGGGISTVNVSGELKNLGRISSVTQLTINADELNNYGALASNDRLVVSAEVALNEKGVIFSGADMSLIGRVLVNKYGDIYSLGKIHFGKDDVGGWADRLENISGTIESMGDMRLDVASIENRKDVFKVSSTRTSSSIGMRATGSESGHMVLFESYKSTLEEDSPSANISSGGDLDILGGVLLNSASIISAQGNFSADLGEFTNSGADLGDYSVLKSFELPHITEDKYVASFWRSIMGYNSINDPEYTYSESRGGAFGSIRYWDGGWNESRIFLRTAAGGTAQRDTKFFVGWKMYSTFFSPGTVRGISPPPAYNPSVSSVLPGEVAGASFFDTRIITEPGVAGSGSAVVQAGGSVNINATQHLTNSVIRGGQLVSKPSGTLFETAIPGVSTATVINLHPQLPPDLSQQQVNPLTLPGFSLPTGQNGLFRLSVQTGSNVAITQQSGTDGQVSTTTRQLAGVVRQNSGLSANASAFDSSASSNASGSQLTVPGSTAQALLGNLPTPNAHKYLIETNPVLTNLRQFMSSDYLLTNLGYDPDVSARRLGDGLYEQRLVQQAVVARTGQAFLNGQTSNEAQFKYLMDNAIASKEQLNLAVGVSLSSQQVAALTHDIVWLEEHEVNGEKVLVPVVYLAQANNRLAPTGALIVGNDVTLIAGEDLDNVGTLRATNNLSATAGNNLVNAGLTEAGNRLDLLAGNDLTNKAGGILYGRDVTLTATRGDVLNERTVTRYESKGGNATWREDFVDNAARIESANDLSITSGRDVQNIGGTLQAGRDLRLIAGRDVNIESLQVEKEFAQGTSHTASRITQLGASVSAGRDLTAQSGRNISIIASTVDAKRDISMVATENLVLASAANEQHSYSKSKKVTSKKDSITQVSSALSANGNVELNAGKDMEVIASDIRAGGNIDIDAAQDLSITSAMNESASFYSKKSKGSFGRSSGKQQESYDSTNIASVLEAGGDLTVNTSKSADGGLVLNGGHDVTVIGSQLKAGNDLLVGATNDVAVLSGIEEHGSYSKKTKSGFLGMSKSGKSQLTTTASQVASELEADNDVVIAAGNDTRLRASEVSAGNDVELRAGLVNESGDINLVSANDTAYSRSEEYKKKTGLSASGGFLSISSAKEAGREAQSSTSVGSQVLADRDAMLQAERDINVLGSGVNAGRNVSLNAGRDVNVAATNNTSAEHKWSSNKQVGIGVAGDDNGVSLFMGADSLKEKERHEQQTAAASQISAGQDLVVNAKRDINQVGSDLSAANDIDLIAGRNINIDAARETQLIEQQRETERNGLGVSINHNFGKTQEAVNGAGQGDNAISQGSSLLKGVDAISQFLAGPTADVKLGNSKQSSSQQVIEQTSRSSTLNAGNDLNINASNDVTIKGGQLQTGRDINIKGRDITLDVTKDSISQESSQRESWAGIHGGTSGGFKIGIGGSYGAANEEGTYGSSTTTQVAAGRDINLDASHDMTLVGTQVTAGRDIELNAGNDLNIGSAQNESNSESNRHSGGGEVGLAFGFQGVGVYASVSMGKGNLEREGIRQQDAHLNAGSQLGFTSGNDTNVAGATLRGDEIVGRVGGDLNVSSVTDTGKVKGKESDFSATITIGPGPGISGSVGRGATNGSTNWVGQQTSITGKNRVDIRTEDHTQLDGALISSDSDNLKLNTGTLGFSNIAGKDKEHGYYLNVGGTYGLGGATTQDASQEGKGEQSKNGWSVEGWNYEKDREQIVRATVGAGEVVVRKDAETGEDSTVGLNRDVNKAYEITKDEESRTDFYVSRSSLEAVSDPSGTLKVWKEKIENYSGSIEGALEDALSLVNGPVAVVDQVWKEVQAQRVSLDDVSSSARAKLGDELALNLAKVLVRSGKDSGDIDSFNDNDIAVIKSFAQKFIELGNGQAYCEASEGCSTEAQGDVDYTHYRDEYSNNKVVGLTTLKLDTPGKKILEQSERLQSYLDSLPVEQAQLLALGVQAAMGPAKMAAGLAGNVLVDKLFGDKLTEIKESLAKTLASELSGEDRARLEKSDKLFKELYELKVGDQKGDVYVRGATTLINIALGTAANGVGVVGGRVIETGGIAGSNKKSDDLKIDLDQKFGETPQKGWVDKAPASKLPSVLPDSYRDVTVSDKSGLPGDGPRVISLADQKAAHIPVVKINSTNAIKGSPEYEILNNPRARESNTRYELDNGDSFRTNNAGLVEEYTFTPQNIKVPRDSRQTAAGKEGLETDVGGHVKACSQGGTCDGYNLFPQDKNFNNSAYKVFYENKIRAALNDPNKVVGETHVKFIREDPSAARPDALDLTYTIDGKTITLRFQNEANVIPEQI